MGAAIPVSTLALSVVICTRHRAESLRETLNCLLVSYRSGLRVEFVVIDNGGDSETKGVVASFRQLLPLRYFREEREGKGHSLNRALDAGGLGEIIAGLDDDMSPEPNWIQEVLASCERHPEVDIFGGHVYVIWPTASVPLWAEHCRQDVRCWALSALGRREVAPDDWLLRRDRFPCGNHFWFRSRLLTPQSRFGDLWVPEPALFLNFRETGSKAMICNRVTAGHRVQPGLLDPKTHYVRAKVIGHNFATDAMRPFRPSLKAPRTFHRHPILTRIYCFAKLGQFGALYVVARLAGSKGMWAERRIYATERIAFFRVLLQISGEDEPYQIFKSVR